MFMEFLGDSDMLTPEVVMAILSAIVAISTGVIGLLMAKIKANSDLALQLAHHTAGKVEEIARSTNGMQEQLQNEIRTAAFAAGGHQARVDLRESAAYQPGEPAPLHVVETEREDPHK